MHEFLKTKPIKIECFSLCFMLFSCCVSRKIRRLFYWKPEPRHLLTEEEYREQGEEETRRALEELRRQCNSPEFSPWKMVSRLQSPQRWLQWLHWHTNDVTFLIGFSLLGRKHLFFCTCTVNIWLCQTLVELGVCDLFLNFSCINFLLSFFICTVCHSCWHYSCRFIQVCWFCWGILPLDAKWSICPRTGVWLGSIVVWHWWWWWWW